MNVVSPILCENDLLVDNHHQGMLVDSTIVVGIFTLLGGVVAQGANLLNTKIQHKNAIAQIREKTRLEKSQELWTAVSKLSSIVEELTSGTCERADELWDQIPELIHRVHDLRFWADYGGSLRAELIAGSRLLDRAALEAMNDKTINQHLYDLKLASIELREALQHQVLPRP